MTKGGPLFFAGMMRASMNMSVRMHMRALAFLLALVLVPGLGLAQQQGAAAQSAAQSQTIGDIQISGTQRVEEGTVRSYLTLREGDVFDAAEIDASLKRLFATELFADVRMRREGNTLVVDVTENPIINRIAFEGNERLEDQDLQKEINLKPRYVFTSKKATEDTKRILEIYRRSGRFGATVEPKVIQKDQNRVDLVFEINEGKISQVRRIIFKGNENFSSSTLMSEIATKEAAWFRVLSSGDTYDPDRLNFDKELLRRFYLKNGYADFEVKTAVAELSPDKESFFITFDIEEGERYKVASAQVKSPLKDLEGEELNPILTIEENEWYNAEDVDSSISALTDYLGDNGYAFIEIEADVDRNEEDKTLDVAFVLEEGPKVYVERIEIEGNVRTKDHVIRREFQLAEGDAFNTSRVRDSRRNLTNLGFFRGVEVEPVPGSAPDRTVLKTKVQEKSTGELSLGAGFSTSESLLGNFRIREKNLLGKGQDLRFSAMVSERRTEFDIGFTEPYFLDRKLSAGFDVFRTTREQSDNSSFEEKRVGGALRAGYNINANITQNFKYLMEEVSIEDIEPGASRFIVQQAGTNTTSEIGQSLMFDYRDNRFNPSNGYFARVGTYVAGLGGNVNYMKGTLDAGYYVPFAEEWIFSQEFKSGLIESYGDSDAINIADRFFLGGTSLRGFAPAGVGPRDISTNDALGGNLFYTLSTELTFPTFLPDELGVMASVFVDAGKLEDVDDTGANIRDTGSLRVSTGVGLGWRSPFGPIRIDYSKAVQKEDYDELESLQFNFGTQF